jgi:hypothetical protein
MSTFIEKDLSSFFNMDPTGNFVTELMLMKVGPRLDDGCS